MCLGPHIHTGLNKRHKLGECKYPKKSRQSNQIRFSFYSFVPAMKKADLNDNESPIERKIGRKKHKGSKIFLNNQKNIHNDRKQVFLVEDFAESKITL